ncbi:MAG: nucleoside monophosphate kinase [Candidatus Yanofskybacteria bacterium]|nr:nucleoside monophosphate kinase [Candidatus Yanofskybacteria bacterium]
MKNYVVQLLDWSQEAANTLEGEHKKLAIILIGPIGSGKGTQAEFLAEKFGLYNFETSKIIEEKIKNADATDEIMMREKNKWATGQLNTPELVKRWVLEKIGELHKEGSGIVFSGSPRTLEEAEAELPVLENLFGRKGVKVIHIQLGESESIKRNSHRRICKANRHPIPNFPQFQNITTCPRDGSELVTRVLDDPEVIKVRYQEYLNRTEPILDFLKKREYNIIEINGEQSIENVFRDILDKIND